LGAAGGAFIEVMQQIMAAVQSASQLEVADLLEQRASDGTLPNFDPADGHTEAHGTSVSSLLKRKPVGAEQPGWEEAEGSEMPNAKRQKVDQGASEQVNGSAEGAEVGVSGTLDQRQGQSRTTALDDRPTSLSALGLKAAAAVVAAPSGGHEQPVGFSMEADARGSETTADARPSHDDASLHAAMHNGLPSTALPDRARVDPVDQADPRTSLPDQDASNNIDQPGLCTKLPNQATTNGPNRAGPNMVLPDQASLNGPDQPGPSTDVPDQATTNGPDQPGPSTAVPDQAATNGCDQAGPSTGVADQDMEEGVSPEVKEKQEHARARVRAWRKVLLDGLDLLAELTAAAAADDPEDLECAQESQVGDIQDC